MLFKDLKVCIKHDEDCTHELYDPSNDRYIKATWSRYHNAYDCDVMEYDYDGNKEMYSSQLLTDADLRDTVIQ